MLLTPRNQTPAQQADNEYTSYLARKSNQDIATQSLLIQYIAVLSDIEIPEESNEEEVHETDEENV